MASSLSLFLIIQSPQVSEIRIMYSGNCVFTSMLLLLHREILIATQYNAFFLDSIVMDVSGGRRVVDNTMADGADDLSSFLVASVRLTCNHTD